MRVEQVNENFAKLHMADGSVLHVMDGPEPGDFHCHPWNARINVISGGYIAEVLDLPSGQISSEVRTEGDYFYLPARHIHKITRVVDGGCITRARYGPTIRTSHFYRFIDGRWQTRPWWPGTEFSDDFTEHS